MKAYNYTIAEEYQQKIYIPFIGLELKGRGMILLITLGTIAGTLSLGVPFSLLLGSTGFAMAFMISVVIEVIMISFLSEKNSETGRTKLIAFYYNSIKKYRTIIDSKGTRHYLPSKREGVIFLNVCRTTPHVRKHRFIQ